MKTKKIVPDYRHWLLLLLCIVMPNITVVYAQTLHIEQLNHDFKVFKSLESNQLFWPKALPVYVWLSTSSEQNAPKHALNNASLHTSEGTDPLDQARIDLELSGNQYMRWINYETKDTLLLQFQSDGIKPTSIINLNGADIYNTDDIVFIGNGLKASFEGNDAHSGVENIYVSVNGASFSPYFGTYEFNQEKEYSVYYYAVDNVGNVESAKNSSFIVDLTPPTSKHQIEGIHQGAILSSTASITLSSNDILSGVRNLMYSIDNESFDENYSNAVSIATLPEGAHTLYYLATDNVGNTENTNAFEFYLDRTAPHTNLRIVGDQYSNSKLYVSNRTQYRLEANDNKTGVNAIHYQINTLDSITYQKGVFQLPEQEGEYLLSFWAADNVSNIEKKNKSLLNLDTTPPSSSHSFNGTSFTQRGSTWIPSSTTVALSATDKGAGVKQIQYSIEGESQNLDYSASLSFKNEGKVTVHYWGIDQVQNREHEQKLSLVVDNTPPELVINFSSAKIGSVNASDGSVLDQYPTNTTMYLAATDASSGAKGLWYTLNDEEEIPFSSAITFSVVGEQKISLRSTDNVGNETIETLRFLISD